MHLGLSVGIVLAAASGVNAQSINVDFAAPNGTGYTGAAPGPGTDPETFSLVTVGGGTTGPVDVGGVDITVSGLSGSQNGEFQGGSPPANELLKDFGYVNPGGTGTLTLDELTGPEYNLYLFGSGNSSTEGTTFTINGISKTAQGYVDGATTMTEGREYVLFTGIIPTAGTITATFTGPGGGYSFINALQLEQVPEPAGLCLLGLGGLLALRRRRRR